MPERKMASKFIKNEILGTSRKCSKDEEKKGERRPGKIPDVRYPEKECRRRRILDVRCPGGMSAGRRIPDVRHPDKVER